MAASYGAKIVPATELTSAEQGLLFESCSSSSDLPLPLAHPFNNPSSFIALVSRAAVPSEEEQGPNNKEDCLLVENLGVAWIAEWYKMPLLNVPSSETRATVATQNGDDQPDKKEEKEGAVEVPSGRNIHAPSYFNEPSSRQRVPYRPERQRPTKAATPSECKMCWTPLLSPRMFGCL